jgi:phenylacetate-CoA ligase
VTAGSRGEARGRPGAVLPGDPGTGHARPGAAERARLTALAAALQWRERGAAYSPPEALAARQSRRLRQILEHAGEQVPHYREAMAGLGLAPGDLADARDLGRLPLVTREMLQADPDRFRSSTGRVEQRVRLRSSGSTAVPIEVARSPEDLVRMQAPVLRIQPALRDAGIPRWRRRILRIVPPAGSSAAMQSSYRSSLATRADPRTVATSVPMDTDPAAIVAAINDFRPHMVSGYGSTLETLFSYLLHSGERFHRPTVASYFADGLRPRAREIISGEFGIRVLSSYQAIEAPHIGFECELNTGYHLNIDYCPVRITDDGGSELPVGEPGHVVVSNLVARSTVLINYRLGDRAALLPGPCPCGRSLPLLSYVEGRTGESGVGAGGRRIPIQVLTRAFSLDAEVWSYRLDQSAPGEFTAEVVPVPGADFGRLVERLSERFRGIAGESERISVAFVDALQTTAAGKVVHLQGARALGPADRARSEQG